MNQHDVNRYIYIQPRMKVPLYLLMCIILISNSFAATIGNTSVFSSTTTTSNRQVMPFIMSEDEVIQSISLYHNGGDNTREMIYTIYADNGTDYPGTRLGITVSPTYINDNAA